MTKKKITSDQKSDIEFGFKLAKEMAGLDIGQTVCVKNKAVIAIEAMEGTDSCIRRAGEMARGKFTVVKVSKPKQDPRFDVPVVGPRTIQTMVKAKASCLVIEAEKTIILEPEKFLQIANSAKICVVAA